MPKPQRKKIDWESVAKHYRAGIRSLRDIGGEFGISEGAIRKRAKKEGWPRDLSEQIKAKADDKVRIALVRSGTQGAAEQEIVEVNAQLQADIILSHRTDIPKKRELVAKLFAEVEGLTDGPKLVEMMTLALQQGDNDKLADVARKVASLPSRIKGTSELITAYKTMIGLERQVFGIDDSGDQEEIPMIMIRAKRGCDNG
jgi:hypothetical protein